MKLVLCPYGHKNDPDARFCTTCKLPIPPDPTRVDEDDTDDDPDPIPVVAKDHVEPPPLTTEPPPKEPVVSPEAPPEVLSPPGTICPNGHWNPPDQERWCQECGEPLYEEPERTPEPVPFPWMWVGIGVGAIALIVGIVLVVGALTGDDVVPGEDAETTTTATTLPPEPVALPVDAITVTASSEQPDGANFAVNVLDGLNDTAWGHCGAGCPPEEDPADPTGVGAFIQFDFDDSYTVVSFTILNGYDKIAENGDDRWVQNSRIASMTVTGDGGQSQTVALDDVRTVQEIEIDFDQPTSFIRFTVDAVNPGSVWEDVTISEVRFAVLPDE